MYGTFAVGLGRRVLPRHVARPTRAWASALGSCWHRPGRGHDRRRRRSRCCSSGWPTARSSSAGAPKLDRPHLRHRRLVRARRDHGSARPDRRLVRPRRRPAPTTSARRATSTPARSRSTRPRCSRSAATPSTTSTCSIIVGASLMMVALDQFVRRTRIGRGIRAVAQDPESAALMGVNSHPGHPGDLPARRHHGRRGGDALHDPDRRHALRTPASSSASRRSPPPSWAASATSEARCSAAWSSASSRTGARPSFGTQWKDVVAFVLLVLILLFRPHGPAR